MQFKWQTRKAMGSDMYFSVLVLDFPIIAGQEQCIMLQSSCGNNLNALEDEKLV